MRRLRRSLKRTTAKVAEKQEKGMSDGFPKLIQIVSILVLLVASLPVISARPNSAKIQFSTKEDFPNLRPDDCDEGLLYWPEDGQCYAVGQR